MGLRPCLVFFLGLFGLSTGFLQENCSDYKVQFERVFSVPGEVAMLNTTMVSPDVFDFRTVPYNITWYNSKTGQEMSNSSGPIVARGETLWILNVTLEDAGEYVSVLRTPSRCFMQATKLVVDVPAAGECGRPQKAEQSLTQGVPDGLQCPLKEYIHKLNRYNVTSSLKWYKGCGLIVEETGGSFSFRLKTELRMKKVEPDHSGFYTCTLTFSLGGVEGSVSETINATVIDKFSLVPQIHEPANRIIKAHMGSNFTKRCLVFVPGIGTPFADVFWVVGDDVIFDTSNLRHVYTSKKRSWRQDEGKKGTWMEKMLMISELREEDFNINYTCRAYSARGSPSQYFTLVQADPNLLLPIGCVFTGITLLFVCSVLVYYSFKVDIVLWWRRAFPVFYANKDLDGKLYDAYVAYPQHQTFGFSEEVEAFALHTLPQVLEKTCDYRLFIAGRDCLPGQAVVDSVEDALQASRRFLLLYTASTFTCKNNPSSNNNNVSKSSDSGHECDTLDDSNPFCPDARHHFECVSALHRALLERSLKVVLVELEEISPAQLARFPESVRHLRKTQGAVCWWKRARTKPRWRTCTERTEDLEKGGKDLSSSLSPSSRFWKNIRYHMPVRGKRAIYPERTALLNL